MHAKSTNTFTERFWAKVDIRGEDECWPWLAYIERKTGYGMYRFFGQGDVKTTASRIAYRLIYGEIGDGIEIHHKCRNRACVNPSHLEALTRKEHAKRYKAPFTHKNKRKPKTHCKHGHEFTPENTHIRPNGTRRCRECNRIMNSRFPTRQRPFRARK